MKGGGCKVQCNEDVLIVVLARYIDKSVEDDKATSKLFFAPTLYEADEAYLLPPRRAQDVGQRNVIVAEIPE